MMDDGDLLPIKSYCLPVNGGNSLCCNPGEARECMVQPSLRPRPACEFQSAVKHGLLVLAGVGLDDNRLTRLSEGPAIGARHAQEGRDVEAFVELIAAGGI